MDFERRKQDSPQINLSALIDVIFILLIFVVIAANFDKIRGLDVKLPSVDSPPSSEIPKVLTITVPSEGPIRVNDVPVADNELRNHLETLRSNNDSAVLLADGDIALQRAVKVLNDAQAAGFTNLSIATQEGGYAQ